MKTQPVVKMLLMSVAVLALAANARAEEPKDPFKKDSSPKVLTATAILSADPKAEDTDNGARLVSVEQETFSLPMGEAFALLRKFPTDAARYEELVRRVDAGKPRSGTRSTARHCRSSATRCTRN